LEVQKAKIKGLFTAIDMDGSGALDKPEIVVVLGGDADRMMQKLDTNVDDEVTHSSNEVVVPNPNPKPNPKPYPNWR